MEYTAPAFIKLNDAATMEVHRFDHDHRELAELANQVIYGIYAEQSERIVHAKLDAMFGRTCRHFYEEERFMAETGYWDLPKHQEFHNQLARKLVRFSAEYRMGFFDANYAAQFMRDWLHEHVLQSDLYHLTSQP